MMTRTAGSSATPRRPAWPALILPLAAALGWQACSLHNQEGPDVTCADLGCGQINACQDSIIAQCLDGVTVQYHVCSSGSKDLCERDWQIPGWYRCAEAATDCEGCRPERSGCPWPSPAADGGSTGGAGGGLSPGGGGSGG